MMILVTGGAGFIGSHLVERLLQAGHGVTVLDNFDDFYDPAIKQNNVAAFAGQARIARTDICDTAALSGLFNDARFDMVVHLAARAGVRPSIARPGLYVDTNVRGTQNLLEVARLSGVKKFIFASSSSVYGLNQKLPFREDDPIFKPISPYAATKLAGEALCHVYHHLYSIDTVCLRFFTVYGPRQRPDLAIHKFTTAISRGGPIEVFGDGTTRRDYTYIDDILQGLMACAEREFGFEIINLGESRTVSLLELIRLIEAALGREAQIRWLPPQPGDVPITYANISKARKLLDYNPQVNLEEGIARFVRWFKSGP